jgi:hypothetical protein
VKQKPISVVASRSIQLDERPVAMGGAARAHRRPRIRRSRSSSAIEAGPATVKADSRRVARGSGVFCEEWLNLPATRGRRLARVLGCPRHGRMGSRVGRRSALPRSPERHRSESKPRYSNNRRCGSNTGSSSSGAGSARPRWR